ncbi:MAG TPA: aminotransferase class I/II-fold pyridoxal phosphate-dependent enzyme [Acidimicrobiales bacterium]|nr:aminotransferase class I/II-fold pyridoxal phosphate-dependent enzyme [Acidimicrobiales bacterium]
MDGPVTTTTSTGFQPPPYPYDRLDQVKALATAHEGGAVDLSVGTPGDPPPPAVVAALAASGAERGYPPSVGTSAFREAAVAWMARRLGVDVPSEAVAGCVGTKELVATTPQWLRLRDPARDTVLYPAVSYPTYEMGAVLAGCRPVPVPVDGQWRLDVSAVDEGDADRALCLWVNTPANPTGALDDLQAVSAWARERGIPVLSDECYVEFTWDGPRRTVLQHGVDGAVAVHSLSKRSNLAGLRAGFYAGDPELVRYLSEVRKHVGMMTPGPVQAAAVVALGDDAHVDEQRTRYAERLSFFAEVLTDAGYPCEPPGGSFYLWAEVPGGDAWAAATDLARRGGLVVAPGEFFGPQGATRLRVALVKDMDRLRLVADRLKAS